MLTVKLDPALRARVKALAAELGISTSELVRDALLRRLSESRGTRRGTVYAATRDLCGVAEAPEPGLSARRMSVLLRERRARGGPR
ncbi:MAG: ribbon-helix-helix protein, CopG family [Burkholderiales bacterium]|nr:ribbon-helix-helix protein, CopG family [Burkholderiales bacterium]